MRTSHWCWACAALLVVQLFSLSSLPFELREPFDKVFHVLAYASLALMLWIATDGRRPLAVVVGVMAIGLADALAACAVGALMYWKQGARKPCAESSARSRAET